MGAQGAPRSRARWSYCASVDGSPGPYIASIFRTDLYDVLNARAASDVIKLSRDCTGTRQGTDARKRHRAVHVLPGKRPVGRQCRGVDGGGKAGGADNIQLV